MTEDEKLSQDRTLYKQLCGESFRKNERYVQMVRVVASRIGEFLYDKASISRTPALRFSQERIDKLKNRLLDRRLQQFSASTLAGSPM
jgi:hypothetical protein